MTRGRLQALLLGTAVVAASLVAAGQLIPRAAPPPIVVGAVFPLAGSTGPLAVQEELGVAAGAESDGDGVGEGVAVPSDLSIDT